MITETGPADRLVISRERLRQALSGSRGAAGTPPARASGTAAPWWQALVALPGAGIVIEAARLWWGKHPLRVTTMVAIDAVQAVMRPLAQRHPIGLVLGAVVVGGALAALRPWRWALRPALWAGLLPQLLLSTLAAHSQPPRGAEPSDRS